MNWRSSCTNLNLSPKTDLLNKDHLINQNFADGHITVYLPIPCR